MIFELVKDNLPPPIARIPQVIGACLLLVVALYFGSRVPIWMVLLVFFPHLGLYLMKRALADDLDRDSTPRGSAKRMGTYFSPACQRHLSEFLRSLALRSLWLLPLYLTAGSGRAVLLTTRPYAEEIGLTMLWGGFGALMLLELYVLTTGIRTVRCFRRDRRERGA